MGVARLRAQLSAMRLRSNPAQAMRPDLTASETLLKGSPSMDEDVEDHVAVNLEHSVQEDDKLLVAEGPSPKPQERRGLLTQLWQGVRSTCGGSGVVVANGLARNLEGGSGGGGGGEAIIVTKEMGHDHDHTPSFRVVGVQISHLSRTGQFMFITGGVFFFLLIYGYLQEYIVIHVFERKLGFFLTLCQFSGYALLAMLQRSLQKETPRRIPLGYYILIATLQATMQGLTNLSMRWLNYPAKMLFKSSRVVPTMVVGVVYMKKRYKPKDYAVVALLSAGLILFIQADIKSYPSFHPLGIIIISMALAVDAAIVNLQEYVLRKYDASHDELVLYSYAIGSLVLLAMSAASMELLDGLSFLRQHGRTTVAVVMLYCLCGYIGVSCAAALTRKFGALMTAIITTARKALTLLLSFFFFPKPATPMHVFGGALFVVGLVTKALPSRKTGEGGTHTHTHTRPADTALRLPHTASGLDLQHQPTVAIRSAHTHTHAHHRGSPAGVCGDDVGGQRQHVEFKAPRAWGVSKWDSKQSPTLVI